MDIRHTATTCPYCGCGCGLTLETSQGRILRTSPTPHSPVNEGRLCIKGWNVHDFVQHADRLRKPLLRTGSQWQNLDWDNALDIAAARLAHIRDTYGPDSIGVLTSARCTNEENYLLQKFTRCALRTNNIDHCARL
ncbi:MAG: molybdopterin-dependent oxidoreductase [Desulfovibrio sp.]|nr:molybdopterin-dependent oxidoreductase [Desulfovibrio sp.]